MKNDIKLQPVIAEIFEGHRASGGDITPEELLSDAVQKYALDDIERQWVKTEMTKSIRGWRG